MSRIVLAGPCEIVTAEATTPARSLAGPSGEIVFARLAVAGGEAVSRDALADAIWGVSLPRSWPPSLRNMITRLRAGLERSGLGATVEVRAVGDSYRLELPAGVVVDVAELAPAAVAAESAARRGDHAAALGIATKALAATERTILTGARGDWVDSLRSDVARRRERLVRVAGESALAVGDYVDAEQFARRLLSDAPLREDGHRLLMRALHAAGNTGEALAAYDACRRQLVDELGSVPSDATQTLFLGILREERAESAAGPRRATPAAGRLLLVHRQTPFVGRDELLDRLVAEQRAAVGAGPRIVALSGEPGLGKTRAAAALVARADDAGISALYGRADDTISIPYGPFLEAIDSYFAGVDATTIATMLGRHAGVLSRLVPSIAAAVTPSEPTDIPELDQRHLTAALEAALGAIGGTDGALLVLDDMQWASRPDLDLLEQLAQTTSPASLLVLVLHRGTDDMAQLKAPGARVEQIGLEPLTVEEVAALARLTDHDDVDELAAHVWRESGGNALLTSELLRARGGDHGHGSHIAELVNERMAGLPAAADEVLRTAAVAGLEFEPRIVIATSPDPDAARAVLDEAQQAGLLVPALHGAGWLSFRHALVRASLLDTISPEMRMRLHRRLGIALEREPGSGASNASLAYHFGAAAPLGDWRAAVRYGLPVARAAFGAGVYEDAIAFATQTVAALDAAGDPDPLTRLDLEILLGGAQRALGDERGHDTLSAAFGQAADIGDASRMADAALAFSHGGAATEEAFVDDAVVTLYEEALTAIGAGDRARRARLLGHRASAYAWKRSGETAREAADDALALARELGDDATLSRVLTTVRRSLSGSARVDDQDGLENDLVDLADRLDDSGGRARALLWRFETQIEYGNGAGLEQLLTDAERTVQGLPDAQYHYSLAYSRGSLALLRGQVEEADRLVERAAAIGRERGLAPYVVEAIRIIQLMGVRHEQGRLADLRDEMVAFFGAAGVPEWLGAVAFLEAEIGQFDAVGGYLDGFFASFAEGGARLVAPIGFAAHMAAPIARVGDEDRAAMLYAVIEPFAGRGAYFAYFGGPIDYALGLLARTLERDDDADRHFTAGAAFAERLGAPLWRARCESAQR